MKFGLIGHPIAHSLSPALFKAGYDGRYPYELIETPDFEEAYTRFLKDYDGINVTAPFKEPAFAKADILSEECKVTGAANILVKTSEGIKAYNSDYLGVRLWLQETVPTNNCPTVLIVGCGGAGKAAAAAAASLGMDVILMNRSIAKAEAVAESIRHMTGSVSILPIDDFRQTFRQADIVIYNIPCAISETHELIAEDFNPGHRKIILEANYKNPSFDKTLLQKMSEANPLSEYISGRTWLLYQAVTGYEIFTGEKPDLSRMSDVL